MDNPIEYDATVICTECSNVYLLSMNKVIFGRMKCFGLKSGKLYANIITEQKQDIHIPLENFGKTAFLDADKACSVIFS